MALFTVFEIASLIRRSPSPIALMVSTKPFELGSNIRVKKLLIESHTFLIAAPIPSLKNVVIEADTFAHTPFTEPKRSVLPLKRFAMASPMPLKNFPIDSVAPGMILFSPFLRLSKALRIQLTILYPIVLSSLKYSEIALLEAIQTFLKKSPMARIVGPTAALMPSHMVRNIAFTFSLNSRTLSSSNPFANRSLMEWNRPPMKSPIGFPTPVIKSQIPLMAFLIFCQASTKNPLSLPHAINDFSIPVIPVTTLLMMAVMGFRKSASFSKKVVTPFPLRSPVSASIIFPARDENKSAIALKLG